MGNKVALLTKETFCQALRMIREQDAINEEVAAALGKVSGGVDTLECRHSMLALHLIGILPIDYHT